MSGIQSFPCSVTVHEGTITADVEDRDGLDELIGRPYACWQPVIPEPNNVRWCHLAKDHAGDVHRTIWQGETYHFSSTSVTPTKENAA